MNLRYASLVVVLGSAVVLGGCSAELAGKVTTAVAETSSDPTSSSSPTPDPKPSPSEVEDEISVSDAAAQFVELADVLNAAVAESIDAVEFDDFVAISPMMAEANRAFATGLADARWPVAVQPDIDRVIAEAEVNAAAYDASALATSYEELTEIWNEVPTTSSSVQVREFLGLPPGVLPVD